MKLTRRSALLGLASAVSLGRASLALAEAPTDRRFVVVILRGALDGMAAVVPYGDPALAGLRGELLPPQPGEPNGLLDLGGFFGLHPALGGLHALYQENQLLPVHAVAGPYRSRSHFDAQDYMESGASHRLTSGWLNRVAGQLSGRAAGDLALAVGGTVPVLLRGPTRVGNWVPPTTVHPEPDLYARLAALHAHDPVTGPAIADGLRERGFSAAVLAGVEQPPNRFAFSALAGAAGHLLAAPDGPRLAALEIGGWDTHSSQPGRLNGPLGQLDAGLVALREALGEVWARTTVLAMTEFGRTVRVNGTRGTDHGTGTVAFVLGGAVAGGRVQADWPGLKPDRLFENRDLQPTADLRAVAKGLLAQHLGLDAAALAKVFPDSQAAGTMRGLLRT
ncbi:DUF1501 domain-containing protein [Limobrevibacterium gyesilva]|uniref:DUF1501 domain-containing protein n=1 Tax=Limobrevibacterium gyesilva TaxID=2991712 RepID=A0AA42CH37_9PROT|nr:DUF1501 domain-containing protein [Limobrevibacterium gyesilva]MCW3476806.1 DUF1501 domain-containing protein [Limobrevibacterium gyesilva]